MEQQGAIVSGTNREEEKTPSSLTSVLSPQGQAELFSALHHLYFKAALIELKSITQSISKKPLVYLLGYGQEPKEVKKLFKCLYKDLKRLWEKDNIVCPTFDLEPGDQTSRRVNQMEQCQFVIVLCTKALKEAYNSYKAGTLSVELSQVFTLLTRNESKIIPFAHENKANVPFSLQDLKEVPINDEEDYQLGLFALLKVLVEDPAVKKAIKEQEKAVKEKQKESVSLSPDQQQLLLAKLKSTLQKTRKATVQKENPSINTKGETSRPCSKKQIELLGSLETFYQKPRYVKVPLIGDEEGRCFDLSDIFVNLVIVEEEEQRRHEKTEFDKIAEQNKEPNLEEKQNKESNPEDKNSKNSKSIPLDPVAQRRLGLLKTYEDIPRTKTPLALTDLFQPRKVKMEMARRSIESENKREEEEKFSLEEAVTTKAPQKLLLLGRAGIGKSTVCKYLAHQWSQGFLLQQFDWVFHLELKRVVYDPELSIKSRIPELLQAYYWHDMKLSLVEERWEEIQRQKVVWLLDGYDEVAHLEHPLIEKELLNQPYYLLTSRPYALQLQWHRQDNDVLVLENIGLTAENVNVYIDKYFRAKNTSSIASPRQSSADNKGDLTNNPLSSLGQALKHWLQKQPFVASLCMIPLYLELLCTVWAKRSKTLEYARSFTAVDLYRLLEEQVMQRLVLRLQTRAEAQNTPLLEQPAVVLAQNFLSRLAFQGLQQKQKQLLIEGSVLQQGIEVLKDNVLALAKDLAKVKNFILPATLTTKRYHLLRKALQRMVKPSFEESTQPQLDLLHHLLTAGFLKNLALSPDLFKDHYYFIHLSFQEYFAALYMAYHLETEQPFIARHKYDPAWQLTWTMVAGILQDDVPRLTYFFETLLQQPRDLYGMYEVILLAQCLEACSVSEKLASHLRTNLLKYCQDWAQASLKQEELEPVLTSLLQLPKLVQATRLDELCIRFTQETKNVQRSILGYAALGILAREQPKAINALLDGVKTLKNLKVRKAALEALGKLLNPSAEAMAALLAAAENSDQWVRQAVFEALGKLLNPSVKGITVLLTALQDSEREVRHAAFEALSKLPNPSAEEMIVLLTATKDSNERVRRAAFKALSKLSNISTEVQSVLLLVAQDPDEWVRRTVIKTLGKLSNPSTEVLTVLLAAAKDSDEGVRRATFKALSKLSNPTEEAITTLLTAANSDKWARRTLFKALSKLANPSAEGIAVLLTALKDPDWKISEAALEALEKLSNLSAEVVAELLAGAKDTREWVRKRALKALQNLSNPSMEGINVLLTALKDSDWEVRQAVFKALGKLSNPSTEVIAALIAAAKDSDGQVRQTALEGLVKLPNPSAEVVAALLIRLRDADWWIRAAALRGLSKLPNPSAEVVAALLTGARDSHSWVREAALERLGKLPNPSAEVITALLTGARDSGWRVRKVALEGLGKLPNPSAKVIAMLEAEAKDPNGWVRQTVIKALGKLPNPSAEVVAALLTGARDSDWQVREVALNALSRISNPSAEVIATLVAVVKDRKDKIHPVAIDHLTRVLIFFLHFYPNSLWEQTGVRFALGSALERNLTALIQTDEKHYQCFINTQEKLIECSNPKQLKRDLEKIRWVPMLLPPKSALLSQQGFFKSNDVSSTVHSRLGQESLLPLKITHCLK